MDNKLDRFFKNKLEDRAFEFDESRWEAMEELIEADQKTDKEKKWFLLGGLGLLSILLIGSWMTWQAFILNGKNESIQYDLNKKEKTALLESDKKIKQIDKKNTPKQELKKQTDILKKEKDVEHPKNNSEFNINNNKIESNDDKNTFSIKPENKQIKKYNLNADKNKIEASKTEHLNQNEQNTLFLDKKNSAVPTLENNTPSFPFKNKKKELDKEEKDFDSYHKITEYEQSSHQNQLPPPIDLKKPEETSYNSATKKNKPLFSKNNDNVKTITQKEDSLSTKTQRGKAKSHLNYLPIALKPLKIGRKENLEDSVIQLITPTKTASKRLRLGIAAAAWVYPYSQAVHLEYADFPDQIFKGVAKKITGFKIGLTATYHLNDIWSIQTEGLYYQQRGTFQSIRSSSQVQYRFGLIRTTLEAIPESLHYLEVPILGVWKKRQYAFELGVSLNYLMGVKAAIGKYERNNAASIPILNENQSGWMSKEGFSKLHSHLILGGRWNLSNRLYVGLRANYSIGNILDKNYDAPYSFTLLENKPFHLELRLGTSF